MLGGGNLKLNWVFIFFIMNTMSVMAIAHTPRESCNFPQTNEPKTKLADWKIYPNIESAEQDFKDLYFDGRRLPERTYWERGYKLPMGDYNIDLPIDIVRAISKHIEEALEKKYAEFVYYPDMGHVHILIPDDSHVNKPLERKDIKFLYHTGELFQFMEGSIVDGQLVEDEWMQWRYYSRNFVGEMDVTKNLSVLFAEGATYNTVRELPGYKQVMTLYMSSSQQGCFPYQLEGQKLYFDISRLK